jgi:hypothetical protein
MIIHKIRRDLKGGGEIHPHPFDWAFRVRVTTTAWPQGPQADLDGRAQRRNCRRPLGASLRAGRKPDSTPEIAVPIADKTQ